MKIFKRFHFAHQGFRACFRRRGKLPRSVRLNCRGGKRPDFTGLEVATQMLNFVIMTYVTGGACNSANIPCPKCNSMDTIETIDFHTGKIYYCNQCFYDWPRD